MLEEAHRDILSIDFFRRSAAIFIFHRLLEGTVWGPKPEYISRPTSKSYAHIVFTILTLDDNSVHQFTSKCIIDLRKHPVL